MIIYSTIVCLLNMLTIHALLSRKKTILFCIFAFVINTLIILISVSLANGFIHNQSILKYITFLIAFMYIVYIHLIFKESLSKKIFAMFSIWMFSTSILFFVISIVEIFWGSTYKVHYQNQIYIIRICLQIFLIPYVIWRISKPYRKVLGIIPNKTIYFMSMYPVIGFLLLINSISESREHFANFSSSYNMLLFLFFICFGYLLVFVGISASTEKISIEYSYKIIKNQVEYQRENYKTLNESIEKLYVVKHDIRHHISVIETMILQQNYKEVMEYIEQFTRIELSKTIPKTCENFAVDSITKYYKSLATAKNIEMEINLNVPEDIGINPLDFCVIFGNCLENAIEACEKLGSESKKQIMLSSKIIGTHFLFIISNNFNGKIIKMDDRILSSKVEPSHGIGLSSIYEIVNKYKGNVDIKFSEDTFEITIIMCTCLEHGASILQETTT